METETETDGRRWRYSRTRLRELEQELRDTYLEQEALVLSGPRAEFLRFENAAARDRYSELTRQAFRLTDERDRCAMAVWRRDRKRRPHAHNYTR